MGGYESSMRDESGVVYAVYTANLATLPIASAHGYISPHFDGSYFTGELPPIDSPADEISIPFAAVIDLETMEVVARDQGMGEMTPTQVLDAMTEANGD